MTGTIALVFAVVYAGMFLGRLPRLRLDRTGVALLGAIALLASGALGFEERPGRSTGPRWRCSSV